MSRIEPFKLLAIIGVVCFIFALVAAMAGPPIDRHFGWEPEDIVFGDVVLEGRFGQRWYRYAQGLAGMGAVLLIASAFVWFRQRHNENV